MIMIEIKQGQLSTVIITIAVIILGVFVADPSLLPRILPKELLPYITIIAAILIAIYNYLKPRAQATTTETIEESA